MWYTFLRECLRLVKRKDRIFLQLRHKCYRSKRRRILGSLSIWQLQIVNKTSKKQSETIANPSNIKQYPGKYQSQREVKSKVKWLQIQAEESHQITNK